MTVSLTILRYRKRFIPFALLSMMLFRLPLWLNKKISFWKLLGTGKSGTFDKHPDWQQWGILGVQSSKLNVEGLEPVDLGHPVSQSVHLPQRSDFRDHLCARPFEKRARPQLYSDWGGRLSLGRNMRRKCLVNGKYRAPPSSGFSPWRARRSCRRRSRRRRGCRLPCRAAP